MRPSATSHRTLVVDSRGPSGDDRARSRREALQRITARAYESIVLYTETPGRDEYDLVSYLAATWPSFLQRLTIRTMTRGRRSYQWNHETASFDALPLPRRPLNVSSGRSQRPVALTVAAP